MAFSPDGRYFIAGNHEKTVGFDTQQGGEFSLPGSIKKLATFGFVFLGPDRLIGWDYETPSQADLVSFPEGKLLWHAHTNSTAFAAVTEGNYVLLKRVKEDGVNVFDLGTKKSGWGYKANALDIYGDLAAAELRNGELGLTEISTRNIVTSLKLPVGDLEAPHAAAVTDDLKWIALSEKQRGTIWNLETGKAAYLLREFNGAYLDTHAFVGDFPKYWDTPRMIGRCDLASRRLEMLREVKDEQAQQHGRYFLVTQRAGNIVLPGILSMLGNSSFPLEAFDHNVTREIRDVVTGQTLWTRHFPKEAPSVSVEPVEGTIDLMWHGDAASIQEELQSFPTVAQRLTAAKEKKWLAVIESVEARTGKPTQAVLVDTNRGSISMRDHFSVGDWLIFTDSQGQVLVYSYSKAGKVGQIMGAAPAVAKASGLICVLSSVDQLAIYDLAAMELRRACSFSSPVVFQQFSQDGKRLLALTADQTAYQLDVSSLNGPSDGVPAAIPD
jgi:hypothetical protein